MGRWLARLREAEKTEQTHVGGALKTFKTPVDEVLRVLKVGDGGDLAEILRGERSAEAPLITKPITFSDLSPEDQIAAFEERAGILEFDGGLSREEAERLAREQVRTRLH